MTQRKQDREISTILGVGLGPVRAHVGKLLKKLDQEDRDSATLFALQELQKP